MSYIPFKILNGTAVIEFGSETDGAATTVSNADITTSNIRSYSIIFNETSATSLDDFKLNGVTVGIENIVNNTSFDVKGNAANNATGNYTVTYQIIYT